MKILGISGGMPNRNNDAMCKNALKAAELEGAQVEFINLNTLNIKHCTGCKTCVQALFSGKGSLCILKDDFNWLLDKMYDADGIIWSIPIFEKGATGLFRTITDRFGPRMDRGNVIIADTIAEKTGGTRIDPRFKGDKLVSYMAVGGSDWTTRVQCDLAMQALTPMWTIIDNELFDWALDIIMNDEALGRAEEIGHNMAIAAKDAPNAKYLGEAGVCRHCHSRNFYFSQQGEAICCLCGIVGEISKKDDDYQFVYSEEQLKHAHNTLDGKFAHGDDIQRNEGKANATMATDEAIKRKQEFKEYLKPVRPLRP